MHKSLKKLCENASEVIEKYYTGILQVSTLHGSVCQI